MFWKKKKSTEESTSNESAILTWDDEARQALDQAVSQAPAPSLIKGRLKKELAKAAEQQTAKNGRTNVTAQDLMEGMLAKLPAHMRQKVEQAAKQGPEGLENLKKDLNKR